MEFKFPGQHFEYLHFYTSLRLFIFYTFKMTISLYASEARMLLYHILALVTFGAVYLKK
jgi:hypothetical protein